MIGDVQNEETGVARTTRIRFGTLEIIELPYSLGDNPAVSCGPPIAPSWDSQKRTTIDLGFFEEFRPKRRNKSQLHLSKKARIHLYVMCLFHG